MLTVDAPHPCKEQKTLYEVATAEHLPALGKEAAIFFKNPGIEKNKGLRENGEVSPHTKRIPSPRDGGDD